MGKINEILNDKTKFVQLGHASKFDNLNKTEKSITHFLKKLVYKKAIQQYVLMDKKSIGSIRLRMYGLPKLHKQQIPLRPILTMMKSLQHTLAIFIDFLLEPVLFYYSQFVVKDFFEVI